VIADIAFVTKYKDLGELFGIAGVDYVLDFFSMISIITAWQDENELWLEFRQPDATLALAIAGIKARPNRANRNRCQETDPELDAGWCKTVDLVGQFAVCQHHFSIGSCNRLRNVESVLFELIVYWHIDGLQRMLGICLRTGLGSNHDTNNTFVRETHACSILRFGDAQMSDYDSTSRRIRKVNDFGYKKAA